MNRGEISRLEKELQGEQDRDSHSIRNEIVVKGIAVLVVAGFAIIGFFWFIDNAIIPLVRMLHGA